jgi:hypothetical protein
MLKRGRYIFLSSRNGMDMPHKSEAFLVNIMEISASKSEGKFNALNKKQNRHAPN